MTQSLSKVYVHITFSTKNRQELLDETVSEKLFDFLAGVCKDLECYPVKIGGFRNHVHVLCILSRKVSQMKLVEELKKNSSGWIKTMGDKFENFHWQDGYGVFSVNPTDVEVIVGYITNQAERHKDWTFQDELRDFLERYDVDYDERFLWN